MSVMTAREVGKQLTKAGRLSLKPLCVYSPAGIPPGTVQISDLVKEGNRCLQKAVLLVAAGEADAVGFGADSTNVCPALKAMLGWAEPPDALLINVVVNREHMVDTPEIWHDMLKDIGTITPPGKHIVVSTCEKAGDIRPLSYLCLGKAEQIRNLCGLVFFSRAKAYTQIAAPFGSGCMQYIAFPAGMTAKAPKDTVFIGPTNPDANPGFPPDMMSLSIPVDIAERMAADVDRSFAVKAAEMTYPAQVDPAIANAMKRLQA